MSKAECDVIVWHGQSVENVFLVSKDSYREPGIFHDDGKKNSE